MNGLSNPDPSGLTIGSRRRITPVTVFSGLMVVVFALIATAHAIQALYMSGSFVARLPIELSPAMNPVRAVLHTGYAAKEQSHSLPDRDAGGRRDAHLGANGIPGR